MKEVQIKSILRQWQQWFNLNFRILSFVVENTGSVHVYFALFGAYLNFFSECDGGCDGGWFICSLSTYSAKLDRGKFLSVSSKSNKPRWWEVFLPWEVSYHAY